MKKMFLFSAFWVAAVAILLSGCGEKKAETPVTGEKMTLTWLGPNPPLEDNSWGEKLFEELFDVDLVVVRATDVEQQNTLFASGQIPDYIAVDTVDKVAALKSQGILSPIPIEEIKKFMPTHYQRAVSLDPKIFNYTIMDGNNYGMPYLSVIGGAAMAAIIRADWLENAGIGKVPTTIAELEAAFVAFREKDPDRNGKKDTYALTAMSDTASNRLFFASIFGAYGLNPFMWREKSDGTLEYGFATDDCKDALLLLNKWYKMELIDPEFITDIRRSSSRDISTKFATGRVGFLEGLSFDDFQWDNDGHLNAKWCTANPTALKYFTDNIDNPDLYTLVNTTDFTDKLPKPYYIVIPKIEGTKGQAGYLTSGTLRAYATFGVQLKDQPAKREKILSLLERQENEEDVYILHFGPEGAQWIWNDDHTQRIYNPNFADHPLFHPQGQKAGSSWGLWPIYWGNKDFLTLVGGERQIQRFEKDWPLFESLPKIEDKVKTALPAATENPEIIGGMVREYLVKAIRGDVDINATWDQTIAAWRRAGGDEMTKQANEWYASIK
jgi:putative aldouronate transport system substrate-binding protein